MTVIDVHEAVVQLSKLLDAAEAGGEIVIARNGTPVVRLVPVTPPKRRLGRWSGQVPTLSDAEWTAADQAVAELLDRALRKSATPPPLPYASVSARRLEEGPDSSGPSGP